MPTQAERLEASEARLEGLIADNETLCETLNNANERLAALPSPSLSPAPAEVGEVKVARIPEPKVAQPESFMGYRNAVTPFITQVSMVTTLLAFPWTSSRWGMPQHSFEGLRFCGTSLVL